MAIQLNSKQKELLNANLEEAFTHLGSVKLANDQFKEVVEAAVEGATKLGQEINKKFVGAYFKARYKEQVGQINEYAEAFKFLSDTEE